MKVSAQYAESNLSALYHAVDRGEEVEIVRPGKPVLRLLAVRAEVAPGKAGRRILGAGVGELRVPSEDEWREMDKEMERKMCDAPLMTSGEI